jgi:hypothetical protein
MEGEGGSGGVESICTVKQKGEEIIEGGLGGLFFLDSGWFAERETDILHGSVW